MMKKKLVTFLVSSVAAIGMFSSVSFAETTYSQPNRNYDLAEVLIGAPRYSYTEDVIINLYFDGYTASCGLLIDGKSSATKITGSVKLQKVNTNGSYTTVKSWSIDEPSGSIDFWDEYDVSATGKYRLYFSGKVYSGSSYENVSISSTATCK